MFRRRLQQPFQPRAQVGRAADVRFGARLGAIERKHRLGLWHFGESGLGIGRVELESKRHSLGSPQRARSRVQSDCTVDCKLPAGFKWLRHGEPDSP